MTIVNDHSVVTFIYLHLFSKLPLAKNHDPVMLGANKPTPMELTCVGIWGCCTPWRIPMLTCWAGPAGNGLMPAILFCSWATNGRV